MIVLRMTPSEIFTEVISEVATIFAVSDSKQKKVDKLIKKTNRFPARIKSKHVTRKNNKWLLCWIANNKKMVSDDCLFYAACLVDSPEGIYVLLPQTINGRWVLLMFSPHFFSRYAERHHVDKSGIELRHHYLLHNSSYHLHFDASTQYGLPSKAIMSTVTDGMILGVQSDDPSVFIMKTFVSYDMLKSDQIDEVVKSEVIRKEIHGY